ncbi:hypothetical protein C8R43DRAFT_895559, partial [Mycena crocata]
LLTDGSSNIFVYLTGHGVNECLRLQEREEISAFAITDAFESMWRRSYFPRRFQANTMYSKFYLARLKLVSVRIFALSRQIYSSPRSYILAAIRERQLPGVAVIERYMHDILEYMEHWAVPASCSL